LLLEWRRSGSIMPTMITTVTSIMFITTVCFV
jgi:hypothetical protein